MERIAAEKFMAGRIVETKGYKKLGHAVNQVRSLHQTAVLQERKTTSIMMLGPLLDRLIQFIYFHVDAFSNIKAKPQMTMLHRAART